MFYLKQKNIYFDLCIFKNLVIKNKFKNKKKINFKVIKLFALLGKLILMHDVTMFT